MANGWVMVPARTMSLFKDMNFHWKNPAGHVFSVEQLLKQVDILLAFHINATVKYELEKIISEVN